MAASEMSREVSLCIKCIKPHKNESEKILKCYGDCNKFLHTQCSVFKPSELKFIEGNQESIKWVCSNCQNKVNDVNTEMYSKIDKLEKTLHDCIKLIRQIEVQSTKIPSIEEKLNNVLGEQMELVNRPRTRSRAIEDKTVNKKDKKREINIVSMTPTKTEGIPSSSKQQKIINEPNQKHKQIDKQNKQGDHQNNNLLETTLNGKNNEQDTPYNTNEQPETNENTKISTWVNVKKRSKKTIRGSNTEDDLKIGAVESRRWIFVSQLKPDITEGDLSEYLTNKDIAIKGCKKLKISTTDIAAFKVAVAEEDTDKVYDSKLWPKNAIVREYDPQWGVNFRKRTPLNRERTR